MASVNGFSQQADRASTESGPTVTEHAVQFLLAEYSALEADLQRLRTEGATRLNLFVAIASAAIAADVSIFLSKTFSVTSKNSISLVLTTILLPFSLQTYRFYLMREMNIDRDLRALARLRQFFVEQYPFLRPYITWQIGAQSSFYTLRNNTYTLGISRHLTACISAVFVFCTWSLAVHRWRSQWEAMLLVALPTVTYLLCYLTLWRWARGRFRNYADHLRSAREGLP